MDIKQKTRTNYNKAAKVWHETRVNTLENYTDEKLLRQNKPHVFVEKPAISSKVPDLSGKDVLCIGCGSGEESEFLATKNPKSLTGIDISEELIDIAKAAYPTHQFAVMDVENLAFKDESFDFAYSSLVLDYLDDWSKALSEIHRVLKPGATFLFSNIHPVKWAAEEIFDKEGNSTGLLLGYEKNRETGKLKTYGNYMDNVLHKEMWLGDLEVYYYTKPLSLMFKEITAAGFRVKDILEPKAIPEAKKFVGDFWAISEKIPRFVIFETVKE